MQFIPTEHLRPGMSLAKLIYNKTGVLLYERSSQLTIPPLSREDLDNRVEIDEDTLKQFHADERIIEMVEKFKKKKETI